MIKKDRRKTINFSVVAEIILQKLGFLDGNKRIYKNKNLSEFISKLIVDKFGSDSVEEKLLKLRLFELQRKRDKIEDEIKAVAVAISKIKNKMSKKC